MSVAARAGGLDPVRLRERASSQEVAARMRATTAEFDALQVEQRPAFVFEDAIGDKAVFSGLVRLEPLASTVEAMLADTAEYAAFAARRPGPPA